MNNSRVPFLSVVTAPATEPVTLEDAKLYLRVDGSTEDTLISTMITASRMAAEQYMRRSLITQVRKIAYDDYAPAVITVPFGPVQSIDSVKLISRDGTEVTVNSAYYTLAAGKEKVISDSSLLGSRVEITYTAGYGNASAVPASIRQGMLAHIACLFENRGGEGALPQLACALYKPYQVMRVIL